MFQAYTLLVPTPQCGVTRDLYCSIMQCIFPSFFISLPVIPKCLFHFWPWMAFFENCRKDSKVSFKSASCSCRDFPVQKFLGFFLLFLSVILHLPTLDSFYYFVTLSAEALHSHYSSGYLE